MIIGRRGIAVHFDLTDLRLFAAVVEEGSITAGASRAAISLPSASARVKGMEEALGTALLERHRRGVQPTPAGSALFHHSQLVLAQMERLRGDLREHARGGVRGHIRLMSNTTALEEHLPDVLAGWLAANPGIDIALEERLSHEIAPAVAQAHADIVNHRSRERRPASSWCRIAFAPTFPFAGIKRRRHEPLSTWWCHAVPMVRIRFPPAASLRTFGPWWPKVGYPIVDIGQGAARAELSTMMWSLTRMASNPTSSAFLAAATIASGDVSNPR
jgi:molybdate transport repressor ModE-like protein